MSHPDNPHERKYASVCWCIGDVLSHADENGIELTEDEAVEFLENNQSQIASDMVERGWGSIDALLFHFKQDKEGEAS